MMNPEMGSPEMEFHCENTDIRMYCDDGMYVVGKWFTDSPGSVLVGLLRERTDAARLFMREVEKRVREWELTVD